MNAAELLAIALAPGVAIMLYIYLKDKHEREPLSLLLISFVYGMLGTLLTVFISFPVDFLVVLHDDNYIDQFYSAFFKVALVEEFSKFVFVRFILYNNRNFNEPFDGIVYAVMVGMGFATLENVLYVFEFGWETGVLRMFTAVPAHATFAVMMGYFLGIAKFTHSRAFSFGLIALFSATVFHGAYDYFWFIGQIKGIWTYIWIGAILSLIIGVVLSRKAIRLHQQASPFIAPQNQPVEENKENLNA
jgi:protease PrsW